MADHKRKSIKRNKITVKGGKVTVKQKQHRFLHAADFKHSHVVKRNGKKRITRHGTRTKKPKKGLRIMR